MEENICKNIERLGKAAFHKALFFSKGYEWVII